MVKSESVVLTPGDQLNPVQFQQQLRKAARFKRRRRPRAGPHLPSYQWITHYCRALKVRLDQNVISTRLSVIKHL